MTTSQPVDDGASRLNDFVVMLHEYYASYHHHKEAMAYAGFSLYAAAVAAGVFSDKWPPNGQKGWTLLGVMLTWVAVLTYLRFQLHRRRWAAIRRAGCERLLARWVFERPEPHEWALASVPEPKGISTWDRVSDLVWPNHDVLRIIDTGKKLSPDADKKLYPAALLKEWKAREKDGSDAILHERLIVVTGWIITIVLIARTVCSA